MSGKNGKSQFLVGDAFREATEHFNANRFLEADKLCSGIIRISPNHIEAINLLGVIAQKLNRHDLAIDLFKRGITINNNISQLYFNLGSSLFALNRKSEAVDILNIALKKDPKNSTISNLLTVVLDSNQSNISGDNLEGESEVFMQQGVKLHNSGKLVEAVESYQKVIIIDPKHVFALNNLAIALKGLGRINDAIVALTKAVTINPDFADAYSNLGGMLQEQGEFDEAKKNFRKALLIEPDNAQVHNNLGYINHVQGNINQGVACYQKAISCKSNYAEAHNNLGNLY
ncbi:MAG: tetratricopeptide repeat protein, partial [Magnetococcales bacterium]|nr:tetratricopeptide repeat protein [Magnetococcales bacterium]